MERNILLTVEYAGTRYFGFQLQAKTGKREITVQQVLERALRELFRKKIRLAYASRTDRGVHAKAQAVNFLTSKNIPCSNIKRALNTFLPSDVRVSAAAEVPLDFHSRFSSRSKVYRYIIDRAQEPCVFSRDFSWHVGRNLDLAKMMACAAKLAGTKDFSLFAKDAAGYHTCVRTVKYVKIRTKGESIYVDIEANGFLRYMVRNIVAFLVRIGEGEISYSQAMDILSAKRAYSNRPAPACGLYLMQVKFKKNQIPREKEGTKT